MHLVINNNSVAEFQIFAYSHAWCMYIKSYTDFSNSVKIKLLNLKNYNTYFYFFLRTSGQLSLK